MSDAPQGPGWWQASDLKWYPPGQVSGDVAPLPPPPTPAWPAPPAGWYPAPEGRHQPMYWNGQAWQPKGYQKLRPPITSGPPTTPPVHPLILFGWRTLGAAAIAIAVVGMFAALNVNHFRDRMSAFLHHSSAPSSESSSHQAGISVGSFCTDLSSLWDDGGVLQAIRDVDNAGRAGGTPNASMGDLQTAATNAQKLADDAPLGQTGGGGDLKTELTNVAHILSAAAAGHPAHTVFDGQGVVEWQGIHCP
jgi:hypothetical protein